MVLVKAFSMCRARLRKLLKPVSAASEFSYRKRRAWRTWVVRMSVGVGDEVNDEGAEDEGVSVVDLGASGIAMGADLAGAGSEGSGKSS